MIDSPLEVIGEGPLLSPSVFNFFRPDYAPPGEIATSGLVAPEMQIATEYLNSRFAHYLHDQVFCRTSAPVAECPAVADPVYIDVSGELALASDPQALVARIADKLFGGSASSSLVDEVGAFTAEIPETNPKRRVAEALFLMWTSPNSPYSADAGSTPWVE